MAKRPQMHVSGLTCLAQCGERFRRKYIENEHEPAGFNAIRGRVVDQTVTANLTRKIETGKLMTAEEVSDLARDITLSEFQNDVVVIKGDQADMTERQIIGACQDQSIRLAMFHAQHVAPTIKPLKTQWSWSLKIEGLHFDMVGTADIITADPGVDDTKTSGKSPNKDTAEQSFQLTAYALALAKYEGISLDTPIKVALDYLVNLKREVKHVRLESMRYRPDYEGLARRMMAADALLVAGRFIPVTKVKDFSLLFQPAEPGNWLCSPNYCGFHPTCPYVRPASLYPAMVDLRSEAIKAADIAAGMTDRDEPVANPAEVDATDARDSAEKKPLVQMVGRIERPTQRGEHKDAMDWLEHQLEKKRRGGEVAESQDAGPQVETVTDTEFSGDADDCPF